MNSQIGSLSSSPSVLCSAASQFVSQVLRLVDDERVVLRTEHGGRVDQRVGSSSSKYDCGASPGGYSRQRDLGPARQMGAQAVEREERDAAVLLGSAQVLLRARG